MAMVRSSVVVGAAGVAGVGHAPVPSPVLPRPAVSGSFVVPSYVLVMMLPFRYGGAALTGSSSWPPPPPHPPRVNAREAPSVARRKADMVVLRGRGIVVVVGPGRHGSRTPGPVKRTLLPPAGIGKLI